MSSQDTVAGADARFGALVDFIRGMGPAAVAFSGGVDSSLVALAAFQAHGRKALSYTVSSELTTKDEEKEARWVAKSIGIRNRVVKLKVLELPEVAANGRDRCYHCKKHVFGTLFEQAGRDGFDRILDGTNADDTGIYRPGLRANAELGVVSPLAMLGIGKKDIRAMAKKLGLPNHDKPSVPCLSTRFPYGDALKPERIERVRAAEEYMRELGFDVFRVRDHDGLARLELVPSDLARAAAGRMREKIVAKLLSLGYNYVSVDLEGFRSGSMDIDMGEQA